MASTPPASPSTDSSTEPTTPTTADAVSAEPASCARRDADATVGRWASSGSERNARVAAATTVTTAYATTKPPKDSGARTKEATKAVR